MATEADAGGMPVPVPPSAELHPALADLRADDALQVLNHLLHTNQIAPEAVRDARAAALLLSASSQAEENSAEGLQSNAERNQLKEESAEKKNSDPPPSLSRRQRKKQQRQQQAEREGAEDAADADANGDEVPRPTPTPLPNFERHVALRICYDGEKYSGLAENVGRADDQSIERALFGALVKARLVASRESCRYSRAGRTDRGVSAAGQVVALRVRSAFTSAMRLAGEVEEEEPDRRGSNGEVNGARSSRPIREEDLPTNSVDALRVLCPAKRNNGSNDEDPGKQPQPQPPPHRERELTEYSYDRILNNLLPPEIRVVGWCPVSPDFSARFSCTSRTYRYFFVRRRTLNLEAMGTALAMLVGTHDFRNFCRMDVEKVYNFERTVYRAEIVASEDDPRVAWIEIHGQAFLWHQIRCVAAVLFLVGEGRESADVVRELLDVRRHPGKPSYPPANEVPLVLHSCDYDNVRMGHSVQNLWSVTAQQQERYERALVAAARIRNFVASLHDAHVRVSDLLAFAEEKAAVRRRKRLKSSVGESATATNEESLRSQPPFGDAQHVRWKDALDWMWSAWELPPEAAFSSSSSSSAKESAYVPLLRRHVGPTYEEKVANLQHSARRKERYVANVIKKRKTKEEDAEFYRHMVRQGSSNA